MNQTFHYRDEEAEERRVVRISANGNHEDIGAGGKDSAQSLSLDHATHVGRREAGGDSG